jgi:RNA-directed DNA polymerase
LVRYADDWCLMVKGTGADAEALREEIRRRYCDGRWWPVGQNRELFDPAKVTATRYRYRGSVIPPPWPTTDENTDHVALPGLVESPVR